MNQLSELNSLFVAAANRIRNQSRSAGQIEKLLEAMRFFKDEPEKLSGVKSEKYVLLKVGSSHGGPLGGLLLVIDISQISENTRNLEPGAIVDFANPTGGWSWGKVVCTLTKQQELIVDSSVVQE